MPILQLNSFDQVPQRYRDQLSYNKTLQFFGSLEWFECLWETIKEDGYQLRLYLYAPTDPSVVPCGLAFYTSSKPREMAAVANYYTIEFLPIAPAHEDLRIQLAELFGHIFSESPSWRSVSMPLLDPEGALYPSLVHSLKSRRYVPHIYSATKRYYQDLSGMSFPEYIFNRSSKLKNTLTRKMKKLSKDHTWHVRIVFDGSKSVLDDFKQVYDRSWKEPEAYPDFIDRLVALGDGMRAVVVGVLYVADRPVASQLWLRSGASFTIYKLAYDEAFKSYSVGSVLTQSLFYEVMTSGTVSTVDFGVGNESYKGEWLSQTADLVSVDVRSLYGSKGVVSLLRNRGLWRDPTVAPKLAGAS